MRGEKGWLPLALCLCLALSPCALAQTPPEPTPPSYEGPAIALCRPVPDAYFDGAILVGDSLADGLVLHGALPDTMLVLSRIGLSPGNAFTNDTFKHGGKQVTIVQKLPKMNAKVAYLWLGANGLAGSSAETVLAAYDRLLGTLVEKMPGVPFVLVECTPVGPWQPGRNEGYTNARVAEYNEGLWHLAQKHGAYVLETGELLKDGQGMLAAEYAVADGVHLSAAGYQALGEYMRTHVVQIQQAAQDETE